VSERLAHWREVVKAMNCAEVTDLDLKRLAGDLKTGLNRSSLFMTDKAN
jgi:hypothetical protein